MEQEYMLPAPPRTLTILKMREFASQKQILLPSRLKKKMEIYMAIQNHLSSKEIGKEEKGKEENAKPSSPKNLEAKYMQLQTKYWRQNFYFENFSTVVNVEFPSFHAYESEWSLVIDCLHILYKDEYEDFDSEKSFQSLIKPLFQLESKLPAPVAITWHPDGANEDLGEVEDTCGY